ncbi:MAG: sensor domain-containing diguanylate cyclase [Lysobacter sp.]|nr:sensor domain-containing diguanylate cyclase [Lysobacter sp.]
MGGASETSDTGRPARPRWTLRREFAQLIVLAVLLPALLFSAIVLWNDAGQHRFQTDERLVSVAESTARDIDEFLAMQLSVVSSLAERRSAAGTLDYLDEWKADLIRSRRFSPGMLTMLVADASGRLRVSDPELRLPGTPVRWVWDRDYFKVPAATGQSYVSDAFRGRALGRDPLVAVSAPLLRQNRFAGVVEASIRSDAFASLRGRALRSRGYEMLLLDRKGTVVYATEGLPMQPLQNLSGNVVTKVRAAIDQRAKSSRSAMLELQAILRDGGDAYAAAVPLSVGWQLIILAPSQVMASELRLQWLRLFGVVLLLVGGVMLVAWRQIRRIDRSVGEVLGQMRRYAMDQEGPPIAIDDMPAELAPLAITVNELGTRLSDAYRTLRQSFDEQRRLGASLEQVVGEREREIAARTEELRDAIAQLDRMTRTDSLTGCLNHRGLVETLGALWQAQGQQGAQLALLSLDVDHFKDYNDRYGHPAGDSALKRVVGAIRSALHGVDDEVARAGGEEFLVLLPGADSVSARAVAERIRGSVHAADIPHADGEGGALTVSIGIAIAQPQSERDIDAAVKRADEAMYRAKRGGRDRVSD